MITPVFNFFFFSSENHIKSQALTYPKALWSFVCNIRDWSGGVTDEETPPFEERDRGSAIFILESPGPNNHTGVGTSAGLPRPPLHAVGAQPGSEPHARAWWPGGEGARDGSTSVTVPGRLILHRATPARSCTCDFSDFTSFLPARLSARAADTPRRARPARRLPR